MAEWTAEGLISQLGLIPHAEGGWYRFMERAAAAPGEKSPCSVIYYFLKKGETSRWHQLFSDEVWTWHQGGSLQMTLGGDGTLPVAGKTLTLGPRLDCGEGFQILAPANQWQTTRVVDGDFCLVSCVVSPAFRDEDCILPKEPLDNEIGG
ncbi:MAG: cupin domain-containing protein [Oscillospiraceae bacterium]